MSLNARQDLLTVPEEDEPFLERQQIGPCDPDRDADRRSEMSLIRPEPKIGFREMDRGVGKPRLPVIVAEAADMIGMRMRANHRVDPRWVDPGADQVVLQSARRFPNILDDPPPVLQITVLPSRGAPAGQA